jgi:hypothetical protein
MEKSDLRFSDFENSWLDMEKFRIGVFVNGAWYDRESTTLNKFKKDFEGLLKCIKKEA